MKLKHIHFIINPASGKEEPILSYINKAMAGAQVDWDISVTKKNLNAGELARKLIGKTDLVAVYGGDGCVTSVASALLGSNLPIAIIPGGTANVMAKELDIPLDTVEALALLGKGKHRIIAVDMGLVNGTPFLLRINMGIMAAMVTSADRDLKDSIGQLAYGVTAVKTLIEAKSINYELDIDGEKISATGVSLTVTNSGNIGIGNFALQPGISITDGFLDVILMKENNFSSVLKIAGSALMQQETDAIQHWKAKKVVIKMPKEQSYICDDTEKFAKTLKLEIAPGSIRMLVPAKTK
ncbi:MULTISPECIES: diacylglycerol kinase family protein [unclassified Mucilaginibacter]|uniref:diacylglycerol/lipid kinase family protein n=1 Tax=unclassified Mucilaginibacter TaxID=2617802 RepID=UPI00339B99B7